MPKRTILIVEDDPEMRELLHEALSAEGFRIHLACDGHEAMRILNEIKSACLVLLDLLMPGMNGFDFLKAARQGSHTFVQIPVVAVSAAHQLQVPEGAVEMLRKPFDLDDLFRIVKEHCSA